MATGQHCVKSWKLVASRDRKSTMPESPLYVITTALRSSGRPTATLADFLVSRSSIHSLPDVIEHLAVYRQRQPRSEANVSLSPARPHGPAMLGADRSPAAARWSAMSRGAIDRVYSASGIMHQPCSCICPSSGAG